jgi:hypothetical protein
MSEYETPIDIMPSVRPSSGNLDKSHYMRRLILDNPNITAEEASAAFAFYDETVSRCTYNLVRAQIYGPKFTKRKSRKKRAAKVAAAPVELKPAPAKSNLEQSKPAAVQLIGIDAAPVLLGSARVIIAWLMQLLAAKDTASLSGISPELDALVNKLANQLTPQQKPGPG